MLPRPRRPACPPGDGRRGPRKEWSPLTYLAIKQAYREVRASMLARGDDKPIWLTEVGWSTTIKECGISESTQASYLTRAFRFIESDPYVEMMLWYNARNNYWDHDADTTEARYGLMRTDSSPKPSYNAFKSYLPPTP